MLARIGSYVVPVRGKWATLVTFWAGEHGRKDCGEYAFWTARLKHPVVRTTGGRSRRVIGRALVGHSAGDRFDRMSREMRTAKSKEAREANRELWERILRKGQNVAYVRPSTLAEVRRWADSHESDVKHATAAIRIGGQLKIWRRGK